MHRNGRIQRTHLLRILVASAGDGSSTLILEKSLWLFVCELFGEFWGVGG